VALKFAVKSINTPRFINAHEPHPAPIPLQSGLYQENLKNRRKLHPEFIKIYGDLKYAVEWYKCNDNELILEHTTQLVKENSYCFLVHPISMHQIIMNLNIDLT
jgi:hypothetical protein